MGNNWCESGSTRYYNDLREDHKDWLEMNSDFVNQDHVRRKELMEGEAGIMKSEISSASIPLADAFRSTTGKIHELLDSIPMSPFYKVCLFEREIMGRSSKDIALDLRVKCICGDVSFGEHKSVAQVDQAIKLARKKILKAIESQRLTFEFPN